MISCDPNVKSNLMVLFFGEYSMVTISKEYRDLFQVGFSGLEGPLLDSFASFFLFLMIDLTLIYSLFY